MRRLGLGVLAFALAASAFATIASAADLPVAPAYIPPAYRPALYDWTGFYLGGHVGAGVISDTATQNGTTFLQTAGTQAKIGAFSVIAGPQFGVNFQFSHVVVGLEGTWTSSAISGSDTLPTSFPAFLGGAELRTSAAARWYATAAARVGYASDDLLLYLKGGAAWMRADYTEDVLSGPGPGVVSSQIIAATRSGFVVGAGIEYGLTENLSAKVEYDFLDFGKHTYGFNSLTAPFGIPVGAMPVSFQDYSHLFTVGINYRFNWGGGRAGPY